MTGSLDKQISNSFSNPNMKIVQFSWKKDWKFLDFCNIEHTYIAYITHFSCSWKLPYSAQNPRIDGQVPIHWGNTGFMLIELSWCFFRVSVAVPFLQWLITSFSDNILNFYWFYFINTVKLKIQSKHFSARCVICVHTRDPLKILNLWIILAKNSWQNNFCNRSAIIGNFILRAKHKPFLYNLFYWHFWMDISSLNNWFWELPKNSFNVCTINMITVYYYSKLIPFFKNNFWLRFFLLKRRWNYFLITEFELCIMNLD